MLVPKCFGGHDQMENNLKQISKFVFDEILVFQPKIGTTDLFEKLRSKFALKSKIKLKTTKLFMTAMTHKSFANEMKAKIDHNERLEFLGDAALELVITDVLMGMYPKMTEGNLSKLRAAIVNENSLAALALFIDLDKNILCGRGEFGTKGYEKASLLSDSFEALLGCIYQQNGLDAVRIFLLRTITDFERVEGVKVLSEDILLDFDAKSRLQEISMKEYKTTPKYLFTETTIDGHSLFEISISINGVRLGSLSDVSKKKGMQKLAKYILTNNVLSNNEEQLCL